MLVKIERVINDIMISVFFHDVKIQKKMIMLVWNISNIKNRIINFWYIEI